MELMPAGLTGSRPDENKPKFIQKPAFKKEVQSSERTDEPRKPEPDT
ncbi:conserved hypothetical protein, partial [delta proteobacterium NaphS2]